MIDFHKFSIKSASRERVNFWGQVLHAPKRLPDALGRPSESDTLTFPALLGTGYKSRSAQPLLFPTGLIADTSENEQHTRSISAPTPLTLTIHLWTGRYLQYLVGSHKRC